MKLLSLSSAIFIGICQLATAKQSVHTNMKEKLEEVTDHVGAITTTTALGERSITTTTAWPSKEGNDWYISCDPILWKAKIGETAFATTNNKFSIDQPIYGSVKDNKMHWDLGLKVGLGTKLNYDTWGLLGEFTYFKTTGGATTQGAIQDAVIPLKGPYAHPAQYAHSQIHFTFLNLDVFLSRHYFISRTLALNPLIGVKNTWNHLKQNVWYSKGSYLLNNSAITKDSSKIWGIGPQVGINTQWYLGRGFHGIGFLSTSLLYSYIQAKQNSCVTPFQDLDLHVSQKNHQFIPNMQCNLGLGWSRFLNENKNYLTIDLTYEAQYYWNMNQTLSLYEFKETLRMQNAAADIALYGVTLRVKVFF